MPYIIKRTPSCPANKPYGVFNKNTNDLRGRCHESRAKALAQMRALYAAESGKMNSEVAVVNLVKEFSDDWLEGNKKWIKVYPYSSWSHPLFTDTSIDEDTALALKESFDNKYYGEQDYVVSYDHGLDPAKGGKAAGWYELLEVRDDGLWGLVRFTQTARQEIDAGEWRYFSGEHFDEYENPHTGEVHNLVFSGGAVTNKPYVKEGMVPLNFSDVYIEKEFAWSTAYKNNLPDSAFLYIAPGGKKDSEGKTIPRSLRFFPVKDSSGKVDQAHVTAALRLIPKAGVSSSIKATALAKAKRLAGSKSNSEVDMDPVDEHVPEEHADPGQTGDEASLEGANNDDAADTGSRINTPPPSPFEQTDARLREILNLDPDADIIKAATDLVAEVKPLRDAAKAHSEKKSFAEMYPEQAAKLKRLEDKDREESAKAFSERYSNLPDETGKFTNKGFPAVVTDKLTALHKSFSEGSGTIVDVTEVLDLIAKTGLVDYTETGSSRHETYVPDPPKAFADKVIEIQNDDKVDYRTAVKLASERHPDLYEGYRKSIPGRR